VLAGDVEARLAAFTELVAAAISDADAQAEVRRLADQQTALRRVATLVARQRPADEVFAAVADEVTELLGVESAGMVRYEHDGTLTVVAAAHVPEESSPVGRRLPIGGESVSSLVFRTGRPARLDDYSTATGAVGGHYRRLGMGSAVGTPIVVEGKLWGAIIAASRHARSLPADTESRMAEFTDLVVTAISNLQARADLAASRARIVEAADAERRRVVRDLHDGAQSRLVHAVIALERARSSSDETAVRSLVAEGLMHARRAIDELRELARGIHPSILTHSGLAAAVEVLAQRAPLPVELAIPEERYPTAVESAAYFVAAEALTNVVKYAHATRARITAARTGAALRLVVEDDGVGGAAPGSGLAGLRDRVSALDGRLVIDSPRGAGTRISAEIPLPAGS
jgi:signal transduction histidine kinase